MEKYWIYLELAMQWAAVAVLVYRLLGKARPETIKHHTASIVAAAGTCCAHIAATTVAWHWEVLFWNTGVANRVQVGFSVAESAVVVALLLGNSRVERSQRKWVARVVAIPIFMATLVSLVAGVVYAASDPGWHSWYFHRSPVMFIGARAYMWAMFGVMVCVEVIQFVRHCVRAFGRQKI